MRLTTIFFKFMSVLFVFILAAATIPAASVTASSTILYVKPGGLSSGACSSWDQACDLEYALSQANPGAGASAEIWVAKGKYIPTSDTSHPEATFALKNNVALYGGFQGSESLLSERDWKNNLTVLSGDIAGDDITDPNGVVTDTLKINGTNSYHVITSSGTDSTPILDGFVVTAGSFYAYHDPNLGGGAGLYNNTGSPTIQNTVFGGNFVNFGNGAALWSINGAPTIINVTFVNNYTYRGSGGGLYFSIDGNQFHSQDFPSLVGLTFKGNKAFNGTGGGAFFWLALNNHLKLINASFLGNYTFSDCCIAPGGGIRLYGPSAPQMINSRFSGNSSNWEGGGIENDTTDTLILTNVTFSGNSAGDGGGGALSGGVEIMVNSLMWGDYAPTGPEFSYTSMNATYSDIQGGYTGTGNINQDPQFVSPVAASNAPTIAGDYHLQGSSPAIDAGNNDPITVTTDLDGYPRKMDVGTVVDTGHGTAPIVDMGAYEVAGLPIANAGPNQKVPRGSQVTLDGSASTDPIDRIPLTYKWTQTSGPTVQLSSTTAVKPSFSAPMVSTVTPLTFSLVVTNTVAQHSTPASVTIIVDPPPIANAGPNQRVASNALVTLDGSGSYDPGGNLPLAYQWAQTGGMDTPVTLNHETDVKPTLTTPVVRAVKKITLTLVVTNTLGQPSSPSSVMIIIQPPVYIPLIINN